ncbi:MarR family winged helix-turn-helix transcriptional regulator [Dethiothermospora halolimnae]|uniref:MarR family winged helix-turn-helix transcriptional regulator n=1 Tax=Dethiothermospora halolimnae TaxID=3114390 RepID=UPI003CCBD2B4
MGKAKRLFESYNWIGPIAGKTIIELKKTADILEEVHKTFFDKFHMSATKFNLLVILYSDSKKELTLSEIGEEMLVTKSNITGLIDRLENQGYVRRERSSKDRRKVIAMITKKGMEATKNIINEYKDWSAETMTMLNDYEKENLIALLGKMQRGLV